MGTLARPNDVQSLAFWNGRQEGFYHLNEKVKHVETLPHRVRQRNCEIRSLRLIMEDGTEQHVVVKDINLQRSLFKDDVHFERTKHAYEVELEFYQHLFQQLEGTEAQVPKHFHISGEGARMLLILEDLTRKCNETNDACERECQKVELNEEDAKKALTWLAAFHAAFLGYETNDRIWPRGAYWSLEKREKEWKNMISEWNRTCSSFLPSYPFIFGRETTRRLAEGLAAFAKELDRELLPDVHTKTLLHGDFKTANLFFLTEGIAACDFQWIGPGLGVQDVVYLLFSSVEPSVVSSREKELLSHYYHTFIHKASERGFDLKRHYTWDAFQSHAEIAYLDYVRFLIGSMWGPITPFSHRSIDSKINIGMHKRNPDFLVDMVEKADALFSVYSKRKRQFCI